MAPHVKRQVCHQTICKFPDVYSPPSVQRPLPSVHTLIFPLLCPLIFCTRLKTFQLNICQCMRMFADSESFISSRLVPGATFAGIMLPCRHLSPRHFLWFLLICCSNGSSPFLLWPSLEPPPCRWYLSYHNPLSQGDPTAHAEQHTPLEPVRPRDCVSTLLDVCWPLLLPLAFGLSLLPLISSST